MSVPFVGDVVNRYPFKKSILFEVIAVDTPRGELAGAAVDYPAPPVGVELRELQTGEVHWAPYKFVSKIPMPDLTSPDSVL